MRISDWSSDVCSSDLNHATSVQSADGVAFNGAILTQTGNDNQMSLVQDGSDNQALLTQNGDGNSMSAVQTGAGNRLAWTQSGNGLSSPTVYQEGNSAMEITQTQMASGIGFGASHSTEKRRVGKKR